MIEHYTLASVHAAWVVNHGGMRSSAIQPHRLFRRPDSVIEFDSAEDLRDHLESLERDEE